MSGVPSWVEKYRGRPFQWHGDGPEAYDCYGLVRAVLREQWGAEAPLVHARGKTAIAAIEDAIRGTEDSWVCHDGRPRPGDVLTFETVGAEGELHVGIVIAEGWMLHVLEDLGVSTGRYDRAPWALTRFGPAWRHVALCTGEA